MTPFDIYRQAQSLGLHIEADGTDLVVRPRSKCPPDFADLLREHKPALIAWLSCPPCPGWLAVPPVDLTLAPREPRPSPADRELLLSYLLRQGADRPGPLCAWLVRREVQYYDTIGRGWDCSSFSYCAARDAACWQLGRGEREVLNYLTDLEPA